MLNSKIFLELPLKKIPDLKLSKIEDGKQSYLTISEKIEFKTNRKTQHLSLKLYSVDKTKNIRLDEAAYVPVGLEEAKVWYWRWGSKLWKYKRVIGEIFLKAYNKFT